MTAAERAFLNRLARRARTVSPELARRELAAYDLIRQALSDAELVRAIESGQVDRLIFEILDDDTLDTSFARLRHRIDMMLLDTARAEAMHGLPSLLKPDTFGVLNPLVVEAARSLDTRAIEGLKASVRETVRQAAIRGIEEGVGPRTVARRIRDAVGLVPRQEAAVANFRRQLLEGDRAALSRMLGRGQIRQPDGSIIRRAAHAGGQGLGRRDLALLERTLGREPPTPEQVERMVAAYRKRLVAWNVETNARTVALDAQKRGQRLAWEDVVARGVVARDDLVRTWVAVGGPHGDGRNRPEHLALHGTRVGFDELFPNGEMEPGESTYNCRCLARVMLAAGAVRRAA